MLIWNFHFFFTEFHELVSIAVDSLKLGNIIALPTDTIYGIAGLVQNSEAVNRLYSIKNNRFFWTWLSDVGRWWQPCIFRPIRIFYLLVYIRNISYTDGNWLLTISIFYAVKPIDSLRFLYKSCYTIYSIRWQCLYLYTAVTKGRCL
jgi:hypothetical protein